MPLTRATSARIAVWAVVALGSVAALGAEAPNAEVIRRDVERGFGLFWGLYAAAKAEPECAGYCEAMAKSVGELPEESQTLAVSYAVEVSKRLTTQVRRALLIEIGKRLKPVALAALRDRLTAELFRLVIIERPEHHLPLPRDPLILKLPTADWISPPVEEFEDFAFCLVQVSPSEPGPQDRLLALLRVRQVASLAPAHGEVLKLVLGKTLDPEKRGGFYWRLAKCAGDAGMADRDAVAIRESVELNARLEKLEAAVAELKMSVDRIEARLVEIEASVTRIRAWLEWADAAIKDLQSRDDELDLLDFVAAPFEIALDALVSLKEAAEMLIQVPRALLTCDFDSLRRMGALGLLTLNTVPALIHVAASCTSSVLQHVRVFRAMAPLLEEEPEAISPDRCPVYFICGAFKSKHDALRQTSALGIALQRRVYLVYNPSAGSSVVGKAADFADSVYQLACPVPGLSSLEPAVRQTLWIINHCHNRATLVTHSKGGLSCQSAIAAAVTCGSGNVVKRRVCWIAVALPSQDVFHPFPMDNFHSLRNPGDWVITLTRLAGPSPQFPVGENTSRSNGHDFDEYLRDLELPAVRAWVFN
jgi:hypothetical protein